MRQPETQQERLVLWGIVLCAALLRLAYALTPRVVRWDEASHLLVARNLMRGLGYSETAGIPDVHLPPVVPFASAALLKLGLSPDWATATLHIITGALLCLPIYALARDIYGRRAGFIAAVLVAVYPALAAWPFLWSTMTESPFLLFTFTGVWAVRRSLASGRSGWYAGTGLCFALAYLTRPEGLTYFAVLGLFMVGWHLARRTFWRAATIARLALAVAVCLVAMSPYVVYLHRVTGHWVLSGKVGLILDIAPAYIAHDQAAHDRAVAGLDSTGREIMWASPERFEKSLTGYILNSPARFFYQVRRNMAETWLALFHQDLFSPWVVALAVLGMFAVPWDRRCWWDEGLLWAALIPLASFWVFFVIDRFLVGALPVGLIWAAAGLDYLATWAIRSVGSLRSGLGGSAAILVAAVPLAATVAFCLFVTPAQLREGIDRMPWNNVAAAHWLAANSPAGAVIMARDTEIGLYSDRPTIASPNATWPQVLGYGKARGAQYLIVGDVELTSLRPQLSFLLDPAKAPPEAEFLHSFSDQHTTLIYRLHY